MSKKNCNHTRFEHYYEVTEDWWTGETHREEKCREVSTEEDIDLHRMKCSQCGEITYYSGAAKNYYEKGISTPGVKGLE